MSTIKLPDPQKDLEFPLMRALSLRRTKRKFATEEISDQELSNILWAACGVTREAVKDAKCRRTAPSARNGQEISIYVARSSGVYRYHEEEHFLELFLEKDIREFIGTQKTMQEAPLALIYVSDYSKLTLYAATNERRKEFVSGSDTGFISQNVYLYCAAANLNTAVLGLVNREKLQKILELKDHEKVIYTQAIGKPPIEK